MNWFLDGSDAVALWVGLTSVGSVGTVPIVWGVFAQALGAVQCKGSSGLPGRPYPTLVTTVRQRGEW